MDKAGRTGHVRRTALSHSLGSCFGTGEVTSPTARQDRLLDDSAHNQLQALPDGHEAVLGKYVEWPRSLGDTRVPMNAISRVGWGGRGDSHLGPYTSVEHKRLK